MRREASEKRDGWRRRFAVVLGVLLVCASAAHARADEARERPVTTRPVIALEVSPLEAIQPISRDGHKGEAYLRKPPGDGPFPAAILIHGGLNRRPTEVIREYALSTHPSRFLAAGYVTVVLTYRSRDVDPTGQTPMPVSDCVAAIEFVKQLPYVDPDSILVTGASGGGDLTLESAGQVEVAAIAPEEPAAVLMAGLVVPDSKVARAADYVALYRAREDHSAFRAKIARIDSPILIIQGTHNTHSGLNRFTREVLLPEFRSAGKFFEVITFPGEPHAFSFNSSAARTPNPAAAQHAFDAIHAFAQRFVKVKPVPIDASRVDHERIDYEKSEDEGSEHAKADHEKSSREKVEP